MRLLKKAGYPYIADHPDAFFSGRRVRQHDGGQGAPDAHLSFSGKDYQARTYKRGNLSNTFTYDTKNKTVSVVTNDPLVGFQLGELAKKQKEEMKKIPKLK